MLDIINILILNKNKIIIAFFISIFLICTSLTFNYFDAQKKAKVSSDIAIGLTYLEENKKDISLYYCEKAFNNASNFGKVIAGTCIIKSFNQTLDDEMKIINILSIIKNYSIPLFKEFIEAIYFQKLLKFNPQDMNEKDFQIFQQSLIKSDNQTIKKMYGKN